MPFNGPDNPTDVRRLLKDLIAIPSMNPMGRDLNGPEYRETRVSEYLGRVFDRLAVPWEQHMVLPGRFNLVARFDGDPAAPTILLDAHQDTVPVDGMTIDPFDPVEKNGRIYGRGACDVKGGLAAMLAAFARLSAERPQGAANVILSCTCDEEQLVRGICDLVKLWTSEPRAVSLLAHRPDYAVVAEPTELDVVVAHRGATRWKIRTTGRACHSSKPSDGVNAIYRMAKVVDALEEFAGQLETSIAPHPLCGPATLSVGIIAGGSSVNTVPDECLIEIDRRCIPGEDGRAIIDDVRRFLNDRLDFEPEFLPPWIIANTLSDETNGELSAALLSRIEQVAGEHKAVGVPYGTHASRICEAGVPSVVFGPGSIAQAHTKDEWISVDQLEQASEVYYQFCKSPGLVAPES